MNNNVKRQKKNCKYCNKEYINQSNNQKYCSLKCQNKSIRTTDNYKIWYQNYYKSEKYKQTQSKYKNSDKAKNTLKIYNFNNYERIKVRRKKYLLIEKNKKRKSKLDVFHNALRKARKRQRTPKWVSKKEKYHIKIFYLYRPKNCHVDHILPLLGKTVSGFHTLNNLQYLTATDNVRKHNKFLGE